MNFCLPLEAFSPITLRVLSPQTQEQKTNPARANHNQNPPKHNKMTRKYLMDGGSRLKLFCFENMRNCL